MFMNFNTEDPEELLHATALHLLFEGNSVLLDQMSSLAASCDMVGQSPTQDVP